MLEIRGEAIKNLMLQREPMIMVDVLYEVAESEAETGFTVAKDTLFCSEGSFTEPGLIEHIAQTASVFAGYNASLKNKPVPLGFIGEVKKCRIYFLPLVNDELRTHIHVISEIFGVTLLSAETKVNGKTAVQCQMKIYIRPS